MTYLIDSHQAQALFEAQTSEWHRTDTRTPADVAWMYAKARGEGRHMGQKNSAVSPRPAREALR